LRYPTHSEPVGGRISWHARNGRCLEEYDSGVRRHRIAVAK
jgi:hypothetical protein